jgi:GNAT superfamily N-acetyltransferase
MISISRLLPQTPEIAIVARWRLDTFSDVLTNSFQQELVMLNEFASVKEGQAGFVARWDAQPVGVCLLVPTEIEPCHPVTPWLAGLFVAPEFRKRGIATSLIDAVEREALRQGNDGIYLYTDESEMFYARRGWAVEQLIIWHGLPTLLMSKKLIN